MVWIIQFTHSGQNGHQVATQQQHSQVTELLCRLIAAQKQHLHSVYCMYRETLKFGGIATVINLHLPHSRVTSPIPIAVQQTMSTPIPMRFLWEKLASGIPIFQIQTSSVRSKNVQTQFPLWVLHLIISRQTWSRDQSQSVWTAVLLTAAS